MEKSRRTLRALFVVPEYRTEKGRSGGVDAVVQFFLDAIAADDRWEAEVASLRMSRSAPQSRRLMAPSTWTRGPVTERHTDGRVAVTQFGAALAEFEFTRFLPRRRLDALLRSFDVAVVISGSPAAAYPLRRSPIPVLLQVATFAAWERKRLRRTQSLMRRTLHGVMDLVVGRLDKRGLQIADKVLVENRAMLSAAQKHGANVTLLPPGVDTTTFKPPQNRRGSYLLFVGRLNDPRKDLPSLIKAYDRSRREHGIRLPLVLAGLHPPTADDYALIDRLGLNELVIVKTGLTKDELVEIYQDARLFIMASAEEGLGLVLLEAMACGVPVVSTATDGARFAVSDSDAGVLIDRGETLISDMAAAIGRLHNDEDAHIRASNAARQWVEQTFSAKLQSSRFISELDRVAFNSDGSR